MMPRMNDLSIEVVACFVGLVLVALFANIIFRRLRFPCTIGLIFVGLALFNPSSTEEGLICRISGVRGA